jgi:replication factor C subunit 3/5
MGKQLKIDQRVFMTPSRKKLDVNVVQSNYHIELTPRCAPLLYPPVSRLLSPRSEVGNYDRVVIQEILKEIAQTQQVDVSARHRFKVVVINEADALSRDAQAALRRTMEKYTGNMRLVLCANSTGRLIAPIKSRCLLVRVPAPAREDVVRVLMHVGEKGCARAQKPEREVCELVADEAGGNVRKAVLALEALKMQKCVYAFFLDRRPRLTRMRAPALSSRTRSPSRSRTGRRTVTRLAT